MRWVRPAALLLGLVLAWPVSAQTWPARAITFYVGFAPGGSTDVVARLLAPLLGAKLGTSVIVENRPGASGIIAQEAVARAKPDGYTLLFGSGSIASNASLRKSLPFDTLKDFVPVTQVTTIPAIVCVSPSLPVTTLTDLIAYVKAHPNGVHYGSAGVGTLQHVSGAMFASMIGGQMVHVPYRGGSSANLDLIAGRVQVVFGPVVELQQFVNDGKCRVLGVTSPDKTDAYPSAPPVSSAVPGYEISTWHGVLAPKGTPPAIVDRLQQAIAAIIETPDMRARLIGLGLEPVGSTPDAFAAFLAHDVQRWAELTKVAGITPE